MHLIEMRYTLHEKRIDENASAFELRSIVQSSLVLSGETGCNEVSTLKHLAMLPGPYRAASNA